MVPLVWRRLSNSAALRGRVAVGDFGVGGMVMDGLEVLG